MTTKTCTKCAKEKPINQFSLARQGKRGPVYRSNCKVCQATDARKWFHNNKERNRDNKFRHKLQETYGMTVEDYYVLHDQQNGVCAICGNEEASKHGKTGTTFRLAVDHCHTTGKVRGLLCQNCNRAIGLLGDNANRLRTAASYLER